MKRIGLNLSEKFLQFIDKLVELEIYPNRSEAIRVAVKDFILKESLFIQNLNSDTVKLNEIHRKYVEFKEEAFFTLGINQKKPPTLISTAKFSEQHEEKRRF